MMSQTETYKPIPTKFLTRSWQVAKWAFVPKRSLGLVDLTEIDLIYDEPAANNIHRFRGNNEPLRPNYATKIVTEKVWDEQGIFWASHFRYIYHGQFYAIARLGIQMLQENKFRVFKQPRAQH